MYHTLAVEVTPVSKFYHAKATRNFQAEDRETYISFKAGQMLVVVEGVEDSNDPWLKGCTCTINHKSPHHQLDGIGMWLKYCVCDADVGSGLLADEQLGLFPADHVEVGSNLT